MRRRPWPIIILTFIQLLTPMFVLIFNAWILSVSPWSLFTLIWEFYPAAKIFDFFGLPLLAGTAVYAMRKWSYPLFLGICTWSAIVGLRDLFGVNNPTRTAFILLSYLLNILFVGYFFIPSVRRAYMDPKLHWWEAKPRYKLELAGEMLVSRKIHAFRILDISEGGIYGLFPSDARLKIGKKVLLRFELYALKFALRAQVVHKAQIGVSGYGLQFVELDHEAKSKLKRLARACHLLGIENRQRRTSWREDLAEWISLLIKTGRGWVPELPSNGTATIAKTHTSKKNEENKTHLRRVA